MMRNRFVGWVVVAGVALLAVGCSKKTPVVVTAPEMPASVTPSMPAESAGVTAHSGVTSATVAADPAADLDALTQALRRYSIERRTMPKSFAEVIAAGYVRNLPVAPPGKKFEIDPKTSRVVLVRQ